MITIKDRLPQFSRSLYSVFNDAYREASTDTLINAKIKAPYHKGGLRADSNNKQMSILHWRVSFWKEYARFQEFGGDGRRKVRNYTTAGTDKGFLRTAGDEQAGKLTMTLKKHAMRAR
jgi:hypothetical protein